MVRAYDVGVESAAQTAVGREYDQCNALCLPLRGKGRFRLTAGLQEVGHDGRHLPFVGQHAFDDFLRLVQLGGSHHFHGRRNLQRIIGREYSALNFF